MGRLSWDLVYRKKKLRLKNNVRNGKCRMRSWYLLVRVSIWWTPLLRCKWLRGKGGTLCKYGKRSTVKTDDKHCHNPAAMRFNPPLFGRNPGTTTTLRIPMPKEHISRELSYSSFSLCLYWINLLFGDFHVYKFLSHIYIYSCFWMGAHLMTHNP